MGIPYQDGNTRSPPLNPEPHRKAGTFECPETKSRDIPFVCMGPKKWIMEPGRDRVRDSGTGIQPTEWKTACQEYPGPAVLDTQEPSGDKRGAYAYS